MSAIAFLTEKHEQQMVGSDGNQGRYHITWKPQRFDLALVQAAKVF